MRVIANIAIVFIISAGLLISSYTFAQFSGINDPNRPSEWVPVLGTGVAQYLRSVSCGSKKCRNYLNNASQKIVDLMNQKLKNQKYPRGNYQAVIRLKISKKGDVRFVGLNQPSGFDPFDRAVILAAEEAQNFGKVPWGLKKAANEGKLLFQFGVTVQ